MKIIKPRKNLVWSAGVSVLGSGFLIAWQLTTYLPPAFKIYWLIFAFAILLALTPWGGKKLQTTPEEKPHYRFFPWLLRIFVLQLSLIFTYLSITFIATQRLPVLISAQPPQVITGSLFHLLTQFGLFPWGCYALLAISIGMISNKQNKKTYISGILKPITQSKADQTIGLIIDSTTRMATQIVLATTIAFFILLIASTISALTTMPLAYGFNPASTATTIILFVLCFTKIFKRYLARALTHRRLLFISIPLFCGLFALILLLLSSLFYGVNAQTNAKVPGIIQSLLQVGWPTLWKIFSLSWWIGWSPIIGIYIATISRGRSVRQLVSGVFLLPLLISLVMKTQPLFSSFLNHLHPYTYTFFGIAGFVILLSIITQQKILPTLIWNYLPKPDTFKHRDHHFFFRKCFRLSIGMVYLYLPAGIAASFVLLFMMTLSISIVLILTPVALIISRFYSK